MVSQNLVTTCPDHGQESAGRGGIREGNRTKRIEEGGMRKSRDTSNTEGAPEPGTIGRQISTNDTGRRRRAGEYRARRREGGGPRRQEGKGEGEETVGMTGTLGVAIFLSEHLTTEESDSIHAEDMEQSELRIGKGSTGEYGQ